MAKVRDPNRWLAGEIRRPTPTYTSWQAMRQRCSDPNADRFSSYGGRGIGICKRWNDYDAFLADMGTRPCGHTLERLNRELDYGPDNCIWADNKQQANNKSTNHWLTYQGQTKSMAQWCDELGLPYSAIRGRLRRGWNVEAALSTPVRSIASRRGRPLMLTYAGRAQSLSAWCRELGLSASTVSCRLSRGLSAEQALSSRDGRSRPPRASDQAIAA